MIYNVEKLKLLIGFMIQFYDQLAEKLADKKLTLPEIFALIPWLNDLRIQLKEIPEVVEAFKKMTPAERSQVIEWFNATFNIPNGRVEELIEKIFAILIHLGPVISILDDPNRLSKSSTSLEEKGAA